MDLSAADSTASDNLQPTHCLPSRATTATASPHNRWKDSIVVQMPVPSLCRSRTWEPLAKSPASNLTCADPGSDSGYQLDCAFSALLYGLVIQDGQLRLYINLLLPAARTMGLPVSLDQRRTFPQECRIRSAQSGLAHLAETDAHRLLGPFAGKPDSLILYILWVDPNVVSRTPQCPFWYQHTLYTQVTVPNDTLALSSTSSSSWLCGHHSKLSLNSVSSSTFAKGLLTGRRPKRCPFPMH